MKTIDQITQSHLSVFVFDNENHNPIKRMPMYAEIAAIGKRIPVKIDANNIDIVDDIFYDRESKTWFVEALERYVNAIFFNNLGHEERSDFILKLVDKIVSQIEELPNPTRENKKSIVFETVKKVALDLNFPAPEPQSEFETLSAFPLGMLATDHVGYLSYSLKNVPRNPFPMYNNLQYAVYLYPMGKEAARIDALHQARITPDVIFAKLEIQKPVFEANLKALNLPAMQNPDLADWYMSPGSFAALPSALIGADGCENLFPANFATQEFRFRQVVRLNDVPNGYPDFPNTYKFGYVDEYKVSLIPIGHSLGEIKYSLPLAPGESVKLAIIDWSRTDSTVRTEDTQFAEKLMHDTHRDRSITETVQSALNEWQRGGNVQGGANVSLFGIISIGGGGGYSTSSGSRDLAASTNQKLSDSFSQASSALREFHSTVVVQNKQEEKQNIQTRTFTNYNHSHTLTILYYEILRHFRIVTEWVNRKPVLLKKYTEINFVIKEDLKDDIPSLMNIMKFRHLIEPKIQNPSVREGFNAIEKLLLINEKYSIENWQKLEDKYKPTQSNIVFNFFEIGLKTGVGFGKNVPATQIEAVGTEILTPGGTLNGIDGFLVLKSGEYLQFSHDTNSLNSGRFNLNHDKRLYNHNYLNWQIVHVVDKNGTRKKVQWSDIAGVVLRNFDHQDSWVCEYIKLNGISASGNFSIIDGIKINALLTPYSSHSITGIVPPLPDNLISLKFEKNLTAEEVFSIRKLSQHLIEYSGFYHREIYLNKDYNNTAKEFENLNWPPNESLIDHTEPYALEVFGNYIAYPYIEENTLRKDKLNKIYEAIRGDDPIQHEWAINEIKALNEGDFDVIVTKSIQEKAKTEKLISLPTRGIFAEGKLGHCNISEEIDETRFWKWEEHPIPIQAPDINPINAVTPQPVQQNVQPSQMPASTVNIVSPTAAPDPQGLAEALRVLVTPNIFSDMSGRKETASLLKDLANETVSMAEAKNKAKQIQAKYGADLSSGSSNTTSKPIKDIQLIADSNKALTGYANATKVKENANRISDNLGDLSDLVKQQKANEEDQRIALNGDDFQSQLYFSNYHKLKDYYTLKSLSNAGINKEDWDASLGFKKNEHIILKVYDYYSKLYAKNPDKFLWAGLAKLAGGAVVGGLRKLAILDDKGSSLQGFIKVGKAIFLDLAWLHELMLDGDIQKCIDLAGKHDDYNEKYYFKPSKSYGQAISLILSNSNVSLGNQMLLENEQADIVQPFYNELIKIRIDEGWTNPERISAFTENVHPYHRAFLIDLQSGDILKFNDRWKWFTSVPYNMWDQWYKIPKSERDRLVNIDINKLIIQNWGTVLQEYEYPGGN